MPPEMNQVARALTDHGFAQGGTILKTLDELGVVPGDFHVSEMSRAVDELIEGGHEKGATILKSLLELGAVPGDFHFPGELTLEEERQRQATNLIRLGFHKELGMDEETYRESLPDFSENIFSSRYLYQVIVDPRIPLKSIIGALGLAVHHDEAYHKISFSVDSQEQVELPYVAQMDDGRRELNHSIEQTRGNLFIIERGANIFEGLALYMAYPWTLGSNGMAFIESKDKGSMVPTLIRDNNRVRYTFEKFINGFSRRKPIVCKVVSA